MQFCSLLVLYFVHRTFSVPFKALPSRQLWGSVLLFLTNGVFTPPHRPEKNTKQTNRAQISTSRHYAAAWKSLVLTHDGSPKLIIYFSRSVGSERRLLTVIDRVRLRCLSPAERPRGPDSGGRVMGAAGLGFHMTQFCRRGAWTLSEERRITGDDVDMWHWRLCEEKENLDRYRNKKKRKPKHVNSRCCQARLLHRH